MTNKPSLDQFYFTNRNKILLVLLIIECFGLYFSQAILSLFPYVLLLFGFIQNNAIEKLKSFFKRPANLSVSLIFFIYLLSGINSENTLQWIERLNINLIYLVLPVAFYLLGPYNNKLIQKILAIFVIINLLISIYLLMNYTSNFSTVNASYLTGKTIWTPIVHVRYSYFVALSILFSIYLYYNNFQFKYANEKYLYGIIFIFLLVFLHVLAVRTGLLSIYVTTFFMALYTAIKSKKYTKGVGSIILLIGFFTLSYLFFPSFKNKIDYMVYDVKSTLNNTATYHTSDRIRLYSILNGLKIVKESPVFGSGIGDIEENMYWKYQENYPDLPEKMRFQPINQFVFTMASMGILGFLLFYGLLFFPLIYLRKKHVLLLPFYILTCTTFLGETTIELMIGKSAFLIILSILLCYENEEKTDSLT